MIVSELGIGAANKIQLYPLYYEEGMFVVWPQVGLCFRVKALASPVLSKNSTELYL